MTIMFRKCGLQVVYHQFQLHTAHSRAKHAMIGEECVVEFFQGLESRGQGQRLDSQGQRQDQGIQNYPR